MRIVVRSALLTTLVALLFAGSGRAESWDPAEVGRLVQILKQDDRGPFEAIRWFCPDGNILPPDQRCLQPGGLQHGLPKEVVRNLARKQGVYLGQVLAGASFEDFLDSGNDNSRLIQYQLEKYLYLVDDGWIFRKARFYRGAVQSEDEAAWGQNFLTFLVSKDQVVQSQFFLLRQTVKEIPHRADDDRWRFIRAQSKAIADAFPRFSNLRIKLHGHPEHKDIQAIKDFRKRYETELSTQVDEMILRLITELEAAYLPSHLQTLGRYLAHLPVSSAIRNRLQQLLEIQSASGERSAGPTLAASRIITLGADLLWTIRKDLPQVTEPSVRLTVLDLSNELETILYRHAGEWRPQTLGELLEKTYALAKAAVGCGFLEMWEWERIESSLRPSQTGMGLSWEGFMQRVDVARRTVEWGSGMVRAQYGWVVETFAKFEPLAAGFIDEWIHASLLLPLGACAGQLSGVAARFSGVASRVMGIANQQQVRGINPGVAMGRLEVMDAVLAEATFAGDKIYVLPQAPADLKPVAGLLTVSEGNLVSHVQLLARNLGIPNGVLSLQHLNSLKAFAGQKVFYAVSPRGTVLMKLAAKMTAAEKALVEARRKEGDKITVPTEKSTWSRSSRSA